MMHITIICDGARLDRDCTREELEAINRELLLRRESFAQSWLKIFVRDASGVTHIICNRKGIAN